MKVISLLQLISPTLQLRVNSGLGDTCTELPRGESTTKEDVLDYEVMSHEL